MRRSSLVALAATAFAGISSAATITYNFGTGAGITSPPSPLGTVSGTYGGAGTDLGVTSFLLSSGITIAGSADLTCIAGTGPTGCFGASGNVTTSNTAGLGVLGGDDNRLDGAETITITIAPGFNVTLDGFSLAGFSTPELFSYQIDGGTQNNESPNGDVALDSYTINTSVATGAGGTIVFRTPNEVGSGTPSTVNLYSLTLDVTPTATPEPATFGMVGAALLGLGAMRRRMIRK